MYNNSDNLLRAYEIARILGITPNAFARRIKRKGYKPAKVEHGIKLYDMAKLDLIDRRRKGKA